MFTSKHQICFFQFVQFSEEGFCQNEFLLGRVLVFFQYAWREKDVCYVSGVSQTTEEEAFLSAGQSSDTNLSSVKPWCDLGCLNVSDLSCLCSANMP